MTPFGTRIFMMGGFRVGDLWIFDTVALAWSCPDTFGDLPAQQRLAPHIQAKLSEHYLLVSGPIYGLVEGV